MFEIIWRKYNHSRDIIIQLDNNIPNNILQEMVRRLVGGTYIFRLQPPRGRRIIVYSDFAEISEQQVNPECTNWGGIKICGDAVIVTPDTYQRLKDYS